METRFNHMFKPNQAKQKLRPETNRLQFFSRISVRNILRVLLRTDERSVYKQNFLLSLGAKCRSITPLLFILFTSQLYVCEKQYNQSAPILLCIGINFRFTNVAFFSIWSHRFPRDQRLYSKRQGVWDPMPVLTIISPYVDSKVDSIHLTMATLCQSRP
jgi:hypothetical protein